MARLKLYLCGECNELLFMCIGRCCSSNTCINSYIITCNSNNSNDTCCPLTPLSNTENNMHGTLCHVNAHIYIHTGVLAALVGNTHAALLEDDRLWVRILCIGCYLQ